MNLDPQLIEQMLAMGEDDPDATRLKRQQIMIDRMRNNAFAPVDSQMTGRIVSPNYGQMASNLMQGIAAHRMQGPLDQEAKRIASRNVDTRRRYLDSLMMANRRNYPDQGVLLPPDGMEDR
jgi:hypothetical protein